MNRENHEPLSEYDPDFRYGRRVVAKCKKCCGEGTVWEADDVDFDEGDRYGYDVQCDSCGGFGYFREPFPEDTSKWVKQTCGCDSGAVFCHSSMNSAPVHAWYEACPRCGGSGHLLVPPTEALQTNIDDEDAPF